MNILDTDSDLQELRNMAAGLVFNTICVEDRACVEYVC